MRFQVPVSVDTLVTLQSVHVLFALTMSSRAVARQWMTILRQHTARLIALTGCTPPPTPVQHTVRLIALTSCTLPPTQYNILSVSLHSQAVHPTHPVQHTVRLIALTGCTPHPPSTTYCPSHCTHRLYTPHTPVQHTVRLIALTGCTPPHTQYNILSVSLHSQAVHPHPPSTTYCPSHCTHRLYTPTHPVQHTVRLIALTGCTPPHTPVHHSAAVEM